jgi:type I restriction enzyme S subunit
MKDSGVEWIGEIPEHWEVRKLRNILIPNNKRNRPDLPLLSVVRDKGVIIRDVFDIESNHNYIPDDLSNYKVVEKGQFAMNKMKAWQGSYGISEYSGIVSPAYFVFDVEFDNLEYFHNALRSKIYVSFFAKASDGIRIGQWDLSLQNMKEIPLLVPPYEEQEIIVTYIRKKAKAIDDITSAIQNKIDLVKEYRTSLISAVVTGKVDVRHIPVEDTDEFIEDMDEEEIGEGDKEVLTC